MAHHLLEPPPMDAPTLILLIAPPARGKTSLLLDLLPPMDQVMVFVSPLNALSLEFCDRLVSEGISVLRITSRQQLQGNLQRLTAYQIVILSYEHTTPQLTAYLKRHQNQFFFIFDEFHLLFSWGGSFRPALWENFYQLTTTGCHCLALSATIEEEIIQEMRTSFLSCFEQIHIIDHGNLTLFHPPRKIYHVRRKNELWIHLKCALAQGHRCLVFLPFRQQVHSLAEKLRRQKFSVLTCVGGETVEFRQQLKANEEVQIILATHALSHGVNLPPITRVLIAYPVPERAMWLQMVGRGGRNGQSYHLYCMNTYGLSPWQKFCTHWNNWLAIACSWQRIA